VWLDALSITISSLELKFRKSYFSQNPKARLWFLLALLLLIVLDVLLNILGFYGILGSVADSLPTILNASFTLVLSFIGVRVSDASVVSAGKIVHCDP
jgi:hypothetical protein